MKRCIKTLANVIDGVCAIMLIPTLVVIGVLCFVTGNAAQKTYACEELTEQSGTAEPLGVRGLEYVAEGSKLVNIGSENKSIHESMPEVVSLSAGYWYEDIEYPTYVYPVSNDIVLITAILTAETEDEPVLYQNAFALKGVAEADFISEAMCIGLIHVKPGYEISQLEIAWVALDDQTREKGETYSLICTDFASGRFDLAGMGEEAGRYVEEHYRGAQADELAEDERNMADIASIGITSIDELEIALDGEGFSFECVAAQFDR